MNRSMFDGYRSDRPRGKTEHVLPGRVTSKTTFDVASIVNRLEFPREKSNDDHVLVGMRGELRSLSCYPRDSVLQNLPVFI